MIPTAVKLQWHCMESGVWRARQIVPDEGCVKYVAIHVPGSDGWRVHRIIGVGVRRRITWSAWAATLVEAKSIAEQRAAA